MAISFFLFALPCLVAGVPPPSDPSDPPPFPVVALPFPEIDTVDAEVLEGQPVPGSLAVEETPPFAPFPTPAVAPVSFATEPAIESASPASPVPVLMGVIPPDRISQCPVYVVDSAASSDTLTSPDTPIHGDPDPPFSASLASFANALASFTTVVAAMFPPPRPTTPERPSPASSGLAELRAWLRTPTPPPFGALSADALCAASLQSQEWGGVDVPDPTDQTPPPPGVGKARTPPSGGSVLATHLARGKARRCFADSPMPAASEPGTSASFSPWSVPSGSGEVATPPLSPPPIAPPAVAPAAAPALAQAEVDQLHMADITDLISALHHFLFNIFNTLGAADEAAQSIARAISELVNELCALLQRLFRPSA